MLAGMGTATGFGSAPFFLPVLHVRELPEFMTLMAHDRRRKPRCLLWHGWLPGQSLAGEMDPWAASSEQLASRALECSLGAYLADHSNFWTPPDFWDADDLLGCICLLESGTPGRPRSVSWLIGRWSRFLHILASGLFLNSGTLKTWPWRSGIIPVLGLTIAGRTTPLGREREGLKLLPLVCIFFP